jgi:UbiD family decarboxylase
LDSNDSNNNNFNTLTTMLQLLKQNSNSNDSTNSIDSNLEIDTIINNNEMNVVKAAIPYMNLDNQRNMAVLVKFMEFIKTVKLYNNPTINEIPELNKTNITKRDMLYALRSRCSDKHKQIIDIMLNIKNIQSMITTMNNKSTYQPVDNSVNNNTNNVNESIPSDNLNQDELIKKLKQLMQQ